MMDKNTLLTDLKEIKDWLLSVGVPRHKIRIRTDGLVDVMADVNLRGKLGSATRLPIRFGQVFGKFDISDNSLTTLTGSPRLCNGTFNCSNNLLRSMRGAPERVNSSVLCYGNRLLTLRGLRHVSGVVQCQHNPDLHDVRSPPGIFFNLSAFLDFDQVHANATIRRPRIRLAKAAARAAKANTPRLM